MSRMVVAFLKREEGSTAVEYTTTLALILLVGMPAYSSLASNASQTFTTVGTNLKLHAS
jgi:Flp pilus assembly pilin Flp